ncbi:hypothetical protein GUA87_16845 [Sneathiella sp. P13V-1]|uniref:lysoplasmalogenase n=1 Tax=Sneathiella sp. P13V-1 TaxID=2697366 RepID=UPI00187B572B|nr:lysoplasmalogenase [Sneathiella sp. P13V-1]MBE7638527.1 hypothetical protein [Sneathiella sp. P13V-1]
MPSLNRQQLLLIGTSLIAAMSYLLVPFEVGSVLIIIQKSLACICLAAAVALGGLTGQTRKTLVLALLASSAGDAFLAVRSSDMFVQGLGSFLIAHLLYIRIFARHRAVGFFSEHSRKRDLLSLLTVVLAGGMLFILWPALGAMKIPVFLYVTVIAAMGVFAIYSAFPTVMVVAGAFSFIFSDANIAVNKFMHPYDLAGPIIWITYVLAQYLITFAILKGLQTKKAS